MQFVTAGGRLSPPNSSTPGPIYSLMQQCWHASPDLRPTFTTLIERIGYTLVDPDVLRTPLPVFTRASSEDKTRPPPDSADYLVPSHALSTASASNYSVSTEKTELMSPDSCSSTTNDIDSRLVELLDENTVPVPSTETWKETAFGDSSSTSEVLLDPSKLVNSKEKLTKYVNV